MSLPSQGSGTCKSEFSAGQSQSGRCVHIAHHAGYGTQKHAPRRQGDASTDALIPPLLMMTPPPDTTSSPSLSMSRASDAPYGGTLVMGEEPAAPVRRICYTPPLPGLTPMPDTALPSLLSTRGVSRLAHGPIPTWRG